MELERVQLNEDGSLQPNLQGYVSKDEPIDNRNDLQKWVDDRQDIITSYLIGEITNNGKI